MSALTEMSKEQAKRYRYVKQRAASCLDMAGYAKMTYRMDVQDWMERALFYALEANKLQYPSTFKEAERRQKELSDMNKDEGV